MILIHDKNITRARVLRRDMIDVGLPCATTAESISCSTLVNIFFDDTVSEFQDKIDCLDPETVLYCDGRIDMQDIERQRIYSRVLDLLDVKYGINPTSFIQSRYSYIGGRDRFCGKLILPSHTSRLIIHHLLFTDKNWTSAEEIAAFCLSDKADPTSVSSFITEINRDSLECTPFKMIIGKRNSGYRYIFSDLK